ncbi:MAG: hypothetical protein KKD74_05375, partial [Bacteroidetes bacterium]|nr:hypothetical protein [Bacteroidota bacterium]
MPQLQKMYVWNELLVAGAGVFSVDYSSGSFNISNLNEDFEGLTNSPIGDIIYNPVLSHSLISLYNPDEAVIKVIDEGTGETISDLVISGAAYPDKMFVTNDRLYVATGTKDDIGEQNPAPVIYSCTISSEGYGEFEVVQNIASTIMTVSQNDYPVYTVDFSLDEESGKIYCLIAVNNTTYPRSVPDESGYLNTGFSTLAPYHSMTNTSSVNIIHENALPFKVYAIEETNAEEVSYSPSYPILHNARSIKVLANSVGDKRHLVINANKLLVISLIDNSEYTSNISLNSFTYDPITNQLYGFADLPANDNHAARSATIYSKNLNDLSQDFSLDEVFTYAGQAAAIFYNPFDMKVYFQTKVDGSRRGQDPMQLYQINPEDIPETIDELVPVSLEEYGYFVELDECEDLHFWNYNLTQPFIDPYLNKMFLPLGGHSKLAVVNFEPLEAIALKPGKINWISFPRLRLEPGQNYATLDRALNNHPVLANQGNIQPQDFFNTVENINKITNNPPGEYENNLVAAQWNESYEKWEPNQPLIQSIFQDRGYKLNLHPNEQIHQLHLAGTVESPAHEKFLYAATDPANPARRRENWTGYWLYETQDIFDALGSYAQGENPAIYGIKHQDWSCVYTEWTPYGIQEPPYPGKSWQCSQRQTNIRYGDMVVLRASADIPAFRWSNHGQPPYKAPDPGPVYYS